MNAQVWLYGQLANHSRGKVLRTALAAEPVNSLPDDFGLCLAFGSEFQELEQEEQQAWVKWAVPSGRTFLIVPPLRPVECNEPVPWRTYRPESIETGDARGLPKLLASEVRYEVAGSMQVVTHLSGSWKGGGINTAYYKKHPHSGVFAVTTLPVWSLSVLDHRKQLVEWIGGLHQLSGEPADAPLEPVDDAPFQPANDHFALMLHLCERQHVGRDDALLTLGESPVLVIPHDVADGLLAELENAGFSSDGQLTDHGRRILLESPYSVYAEAMETNE